MAKSSTATTATSAKQTPKQSRLIKQSKLEQYRDRVLERESLKARLEELKPLIEDDSNLLCELMKAGYGVEEGALTGRVKVVKGRRVPAYKEWIVEKHGEKVIEEILADTTPSADKESFEVLKRISSEV